MCHVSFPKPVRYLYNVNIFFNEHLMFNSIEYNQRSFFSFFHKEILQQHYFYIYSSPLNRSAVTLESMELLDKGNGSVNIFLAMELLDKGNGSVNIFLAMELLDKGNGSVNIFLAMGL